ncbi:hypothetical protein CBM2637_A150029 [Cupriavidus taiwanensis]|uniref:hypothetical protein n=1 Tax=Cupriavidus taiwanensis TaxID=164546 RepID=UPI000E163458|nr:hypothetical protein [Cupriavidus taiwanensis]SPA24576.1 hypothetical protein CBM2637_A150029 [Cupriavidus taiwanensis]
MDDQITTLDQFATQYAETLGGDDADPPEVDPDNADPVDPEAQNGDPDADPNLDADPDNPTDPDNPDGDQPVEPESLDNTVVTWETASGEKFEAPVSELKAGYMRSQDYTHKTQALAKDREAAQQHIEQQLQTVQAFSKDYGELYATNQQLQQLESAIGQINQYEDPVGYNTAVNNLLLLRQHRDQVAGRIQQFQQFKAGESQQQLAAAQRKAAQELSDPNTGIKGFGKELVQKLNATGHDYGFSDEELAGTAMADARMIRVLHDAMQFRAMQAKAPKVLEKVKNAPPKPAKQTASKPASGIEKDIKQFQSKKDLNSFARLLAHSYK